MRLAEKVEEAKQRVMALLDEPTPQAAEPAAPRAASTAARPAADRRGFLLGRGSV